MLDEIPDSPAVVLPRTPAQAFDQAAGGYMLFGEPLHPYSKSRKIAAQCLNLRWFLRNESTYAQLATDGIYAGGHRDTIVLLWLCSIKNASEISAEEAAARVWTVQRASQAPAAAEAAFMEWAEAKGIDDVESDLFPEAWHVFLAMVHGVAVSEFLPEKAAETSTPADPKKKRAKPRKCNPRRKRKKE